MSSKFECVEFSDSELRFVAYGSNPDYLKVYTRADDDSYHRNTAGMRYPSCTKFLYVKTFRDMGKLTQEQIDALYGIRLRLNEPTPEDPDEQHTRAASDTNTTGSPEEPKASKQQGDRVGEDQEKEASRVSPVSKAVQRRIEEEKRRRLEKLKRPGDSTAQRFSDPPGIGMVWDSDGNPKPPFTQKDADLYEQGQKAKRIMLETGDSTAFDQWIQANAARARERAIERKRSK